MKGLQIVGFLAIIGLLSGCEQPRNGDYEVEITETRPLTSLDQAQKRNATAGERFYDQKPSPYLAETPDYWISVPPGQFENAAYQINGARLTVSQAGGGLLMNINRWFGQFGQERIDGKQVQELPRIRIGGREGVLVETAGTFTGRRGAPRPGQALIGALAPLDQQLLVLKFTGPEEVVTSEKENFLNFAKTLRNRAQTTENSEPEGQ